MYYSNQKNLSSSTRETAQITLHYCWASKQDKGQCQEGRTELMIGFSWLRRPENQLATFLDTAPGKGINAIETALDMVFYTERLL